MSCKGLSLKNSIYKYPWVQNFKIMRDFSVDSKFKAVHYLSVVKVEGHKENIDRILNWTPQTWECIIWYPCDNLFPLNTH